MRSLRTILALAILAGAAVFGCCAAVPVAAEAARAVPAVKEPGAHETEKGLPTQAVRLKEQGFISNSMVVSWIVAVFLIIFARVAMKNVKEIPEGAQNFWEWLVESLYEFLETIIGHDLLQKTFWFFATIFI